MSPKEKFEDEDEEGFIEYKQRVSPTTRIRFENLTTQLKFRLDEGNGECLYQLGVADNGEWIGLGDQELEQSIQSLKEIANEIGAEAIPIRKAAVEEKWVAEIFIRRKPFEGFPLEICVCVVGNVDAGKSSLLGSLITGEKDNGFGYTREFVFRHPHEVVSGRTSSVSSKVLGFKTDGTIVNYSGPGLPRPKEEEIIRNSSKLVRFIDLAGHEKYLRTTIYGLLGTEPDYVALIIDANRGIQRMTREHLGLVFVLKLPIFVVLNKVDLAPAHILKDTLNELKKLLKGPALSLIPKTVQDKDDITVLGPRLSHGRIVPIFLVSTVTGENLDLLRSFLNLLPPRRSFTSYWPTLGSDLKSAPFLLFVEEWFVLTGVGPVAVGIIQSGTIHEGDYAYLGPDASGVYLRSRVKSIQSRRISVASASVGQYISLALGFAKYPRQFSKGMVITTFDAPRAIHSFEAEIVILHHPTTIRPGYSAMIHAKTIRSQAKIRHILDGPSPLRTGDKARVEFEFLYSPQFLITGMQFIFREGRTKGLGVVRSVS